MDRDREREREGVVEHFPYLVTTPNSPRLVELSQPNCFLGYIAVRTIRIMLQVKRERDGDM